MKHNTPKGKYKVKSCELLTSFIKYCEKNPGERFWQALRNWSGAKFVYLSNMELNEIGERPKGLKIEDTFHFEGIDR